MPSEKRPRCVSVIGWVWIILGAFWCVSAAAAYLAGVQSRMIAQSGLGVAAVAAGINFLKLRPWARQLLEALSWLLIVMLPGSLLLIALRWLETTAAQDAGDISLKEPLLLALLAAICAILLGIMLKYLRSAKVRKAFSPAGDAPPPSPPLEHPPTHV